LNPDWLLIIIGIVGGFFAGIINTLAGNGSAITLSILTEVMGLPGNVANGTNRIGIFSQTFMGVVGFKRGGKLDLSASMPYILWPVIGALPGIWLAVNISHEEFRSVFGFMLIVMLVVILVKPSRWLKELDVKPMPFKWWYSIPLLALGFYGGFIQMGMGIFFLALMVLMVGYDLIRANAVKVFIVAIFTLAAIAVFEWKGLIDWRLGSIIAIGQATGGYLTAKYASRFPAAQVWAYRLLIISVLGSILKIFIW
jgi:uncharacterized protein